MTYLHLDPGSSLIPHDDLLLLVSPDEQFAEITGELRDLDDVASVLRGRQPVPATGLAAGISAAVLDWGVAAGAPAPPPPVTPGRLPQHLSREQLRRLTGDVAEPVVAEILDDAALRERDGAPAERPWMPAHRELGALVIGPILGPGRLSWHDVRFRRLAASPTRPQLLALWRAWTENDAAYDVPPDSAAVANGVRRLSEWLPDHDDLLADHQVVVRLDTATVPTAHPVLPVPDGLLDRMPA